ncbi:60S ribosomal export protein NMD3 [Quillaja saponaria]|uniref:60S ribosomal export protein NMD3 n=1 Tax=Quillaja saponaria TaxID=32244 RepID=A0AAD7M4E3_QUISA|nr:60S ribosomal export protein NMD3 [Quillaja saponaria]
MADSSMFIVPQTIGYILCCKCGIPIAPNGANMCTPCLQSEEDITEGLRKRATVIYCPKCDMYLGPQDKMVKAPLESKELLNICLKKLVDLRKVTVVDAAFVWTEPHSKRIKVKLKVQKEVRNGSIKDQAYVVEYVVQDHMCKNCSRVQANPDMWVAAVQLRQHVSHRRTLFYLEQIILKHDAAVRAINIKPMNQGIDFFFDNRSHAMNFVNFLGNVAPLKNRHDKQLVSRDSHSNTYNYRYTFSVEICPICREDLICLPPKVAANLGNLGPLVICTKVAKRIALLDPFTLRNCFLSADLYWRAPFKPMFTSRQLVKYIVLDVEPVSYEINVGATQYKLADVQVARESDFGRNDNIFYVRTHLGNILKAGDFALGYDIGVAYSNDIELERYRNFHLPDAILIQKIRGELGKNEPHSTNASSSHLPSEYQEFLIDLEDNPELRFNISLSGNTECHPSESTSNGGNVPCLPLEELLEDLDLSEEEDGEDCMKE